ncbi:MAG TPA: hypothetical protein O0X39_03255 [Methanocorpusculum sp.]|nr:hypothetical protein [Methanocorpusculum sp.]
MKSHGRWTPESVKDLLKDVRLSVCTKIIHALWNFGDRHAYDMHVHTTASDAVLSPKTLAKVLEEKHLGCAITDHNVISGVKEALSFTDNIIPGIEVSAREGPHILVYFERFSELEAYYNAQIRDRHTMCPHLAVQLGTEEIISGAKDAGGLVIAAHPYGYGIAVRGVMKGIETGVLRSEAAENLDGLEVICSGLKQAYNERAQTYAASHTLCMTGGSDAHIGQSVGYSVCLSEGCANPAEMVEEIRMRKNDVCGTEVNFARNAKQGLCMTPGYIPWLPPLLYTHAKQHVTRIKKMIK